MAPESTKEEEPEKLRNIVCFFLFGLMALIYDETFLMAAQDILSGSSLATTTVVLAIAVPVLLVKLVAPWFMQALQYSSKVFLIIVLFFGGLLTIVSTYRVEWRLLGVSLVEVGVAMSEVTFLALSAFYRDITVSAFVSGIGTASLIGPLYYTGATTWSCLPPRMAIFATILLPIVLLVSFAILDKSNIDSHPAPREKEHQGLKYASLKPSGDGELPAQIDEELSFSEKLSVLKEIYPQIIVLLVTYLAEYLSNHAVITTISFSNSPFIPRDHYLYYLFSYQFGKALGRSHIFLVSCTCSKMLPYVRVRKTWLLVLVEVSLLLLFVLDSWFRFFPHVAVMLILCALEGFIAGTVYMNSALNVSDALSDPQRKELGMGLLTMGDAMGRLLAGLAGLLAEPFLLKHCLDKLEIGDECVTRYSESASWFKDMHC